MCAVLLLTIYETTVENHKTMEKYFGRVGWGEVAQVMYTHVSKCKIIE
jgi:hypothetical protein